MRYAILHHTSIDRPHYDLLFETAPGQKLATWRSDVWPITGLTMLVKLPDHRREYLDYEGPISRSRGQVARIEAGSCTIAHENPDRWRISLPNGRTLILDLEADDIWKVTPHSSPE